MLQAARQGGAGVLGTLLAHWQQHASRKVILCRCGHRMSSRGRYGKGLLTTLGRVPFRRSFYQCERCCHSRFPDDEHLDIVHSTESSALFGWRIYAEALRRGLAQAKTVIALTDGARYNRTIVQTHFPQAVHIVDLFHAYEHLTAIAQILWGQEAKAPKAWRELLEAGNIARLVSTAGQYLPASAKSKKSLVKQLHYFEHNALQMCYAEYREKKFFVGSGVVEAGCRTVIGERLKQSGMHWSVRGANAIIALRCCLLSARFEDFWASRIS